VKKRKIESSDSEVEVERPEVPQTKKRASYISYENSGYFDNELTQITAQIPMDEAGEILRERKTKFNKSKKKYVTQDFDQNGKLYKKFKPDGKMNKLYNKWKKTTKKRIQRVGEEEVVPEAS
jgi:hypothetical protein